MSALRKNDGTLLIRQNNEIQTLTIIEANEAALQFFGQSADALENQPISMILAPRTLEYITEEVDFAADGPDLYEALKKMREVRLRLANGHEINAPFRLERLESRDGHAWFELVIPSERDLRVRETVRDLLREQMAGHAVLDKETGLPTAAAAEHYFSLLKNYLPANDMQGVIALIRLDRYEKSLSRYGRSGVITLLGHTASCCKSTFRAEDTVCQIDDHTLALFLVGITQDAARVVLNRLRWNIRSHRIAFGGKEDFSVTVSIAFAEINNTDAGFMHRAKQGLERLPEDERNQLLDIA
jgi:GGDEF domain-containing protein